MSSKPIVFGIGGGTASGKTTTVESAPVVLIDGILIFAGPEPKT